MYVLMLCCTQNAVRSADLSRVSVAADTIQRNVHNCLARGKDAVSQSPLTVFVVAEIRLSPKIRALPFGTLS